MKDLPYGPRVFKEIALKPDKPQVKKGICATVHCRRPAQKHRGQTKKTGRPVFERYCSLHKSRMRRAKNPCRTAYQDLKHRAKQRGVGFYLTLTAWEKFWKENNLGELRGKHPDALTVDRKDSGGVYEEGNIQVLTNRVNAAKH